MKVLLKRTRKSDGGQEPKPKPHRCSKTHRFYFLTLICLGAWGSRLVLGLDGVKGVLFATVSAATNTRTNKEVVGIASFDHTYKEKYKYQYQKLLQTIKNNPERNGLKDLWVDGILFPGLSSKTFENKRIAFMGDSTLFYPMKWLQKLMYSPEFDNNVTLSEGNRWITQHSQQWEEYLRKEVIPVAFERGRTYLEWTGMKGAFRGHEKELLTLSTAQQIIDMKPDIFVANMGLHWLHLCPARCFDDAQNVYRWLNYQEWLEELATLAKDAKAKMILFKTNNYVCDSAFNDRYATWSKLYNDNDRNAWLKCRRKIQSWSSLEERIYKFSTEQIDLFCQKGTMTASGSQYLNQQIYDFVNRTRIPGLAMGIFNDHDVESCEYTTRGDGRHYHKLATTRLRLLSHLIQVTEDCMETNPSAPELCVSHLL